MKTYHLFLLIASVVHMSVMAQSPCDSIKMLKNDLTKAAQSKVGAINKNVRQSYIDLYKALSATASEILIRCLAAKPPANKIDELKLYYDLMKYCYNAKNYEGTRKAMEKCRSNPYCKTMSPAGKESYDVIITKLSKVLDNSKPDERSSMAAYYIDYNGKGGTYAENIFNRINDSIFDSSELMADEIEQIASRMLKNDTSITQELIVQLCGNTDYVFEPPFLFMTAGKQLPYMKIKQQKNLENNFETEKSEVALKSYSTFINSLYKNYRQAYFNKFREDSGIISFYIVGNSYTDSGLQDYLEFSKAIHLRARKVVAYYEPYDNSIVAWASSGGGTLAHEMMHAVMNGDFPDAPLWLNEGLASLYEEADSKGKPLDNYRLIYIQQASSKLHSFIKISDLMEIDKYKNQDILNYNLLAAYSRYFCKFIYDKYGQRTLTEIYHSIRDKEDNVPQLTIISEVLKLPEDELQLQWQSYISELTIPSKWKELRREIADDFSGNPSLVFAKSGIEVNNKVQVNAMDDKQDTEPESIAPMTEKEKKKMQKKLGKENGNNKQRILKSKQD